MSSTRSRESAFRSSWKDASIVTCSGSHPSRSTMMFLKSSKLIFWLSKLLSNCGRLRSRLTVSAPPVASLTVRRALANRRLMTLWLGHFTVDSYIGVLPVLYPLLIERFRLSLETVGLVALAYVGVASVSQPLFGWLADRY